MSSAPGMDGSLVVLLLLLVIALVAINLFVCIVQWWRHAGLADRVTKLEVHNEHRITRDEVQSMLDRVDTLSGRVGTMEGKLDTTNHMLHTVQKHLMEKN